MHTITDVTCGDARRASVVLRDRTVRFAGAAGARAAACSRGLCAAALALLVAVAAGPPAAAAPVLTEFTLSAGTPGVSTGTFQTATGTLWSVAQLSSGSGRTYNYASQLFTPSASGSFTFGMSSAPNDTVLVLYQGSYNPASPGTNAVALNDDSNGLGAGGVIMGTCGGSAGLCPKLTQALTALTDYYVVVTTYSAGNPVTLPIGFYVYGEPIGVGGAPPPGVVVILPAAPPLGVFDAAAAMGNGSAFGAARAIDRSEGLHTLFRLAGFGNDADVSNAVSQTLPLMTGGTIFSVRSDLSSFNRIIQARLDANRGLSSGDAFEGNENVWMKGFGSWADQNDQGGVPGYGAISYGGAGGIDGAITSALRLGAAFAYARSTVDQNASAAAAQTARVNVYDFIGYGSYAFGEQTEMSFQLDGGWNTNDGRRSIPFAGAVATSSYLGQTAHGGVGLGHTFDVLEHTSLTPSARIDYTFVRNGGYSEAGAGVLGLDVASQSVQELVVGIDGKATQRLADRITLSANAGVGFDTLHENGSITSAYAGAPGAGFATFGITPSRWRVRGGAGASYEILDGLELTGRYDTEYRSAFLNQTVSMKVRWTF